jgi:streptomycin 3"-adenylyltransferase
MTVAGGTYLDRRTEAFVAEVVEAIDAHVPVCEAFVLGSGAVGGFDSRRSDVDVVVVIERPLEAEKAALVERLAALETPVRDLELVLYVEGRQPPDFELNLNGGVERPDAEPFWFVLDAALAQEHAVPVWRGRPWSELFAPIPPERIREAAEQSLAWSARQPAHDEFAGLNAARARHYLDHGEWISKKEARR